MRSIWFGLLLAACSSSNDPPLDSHTDDGVTLDGGDTDATLTDAADDAVSIDARLRCDTWTHDGCTAPEACVIQDFRNPYGSGHCMEPGTLPHGSSCTLSRECAKGSMCVADGANGARHCYRLCMSSSDCPTNSTCEIFEPTPPGYPPMGQCTL